MERRKIELRRIKAWDGGVVMNFQGWKVDGIRLR